MKKEVEILGDLVSIPSVSSLTNRPIVDYVLPYLDPAAWTIKQHAYRDSAGTEKVNLVATTSRRRTAELALLCHTDTVPFDPAWRDAVHPKIRNGNLYGRGSCDVKGFLACVLACIHDLDIRKLAKPLALVLTADEEVGCVGAKRLARARAIQSRYMIVGEPTGLRPVHAGKGYALAEIIVRGREAHSAFPARGRSAIYAAARIVTRLERVARKLATRKNGSFRPPYTTLNIGLIQGGTAKNIVAGECRITVEWRPLPGQDPTWAASLIRHELKGMDAELDVQRLDPAFEPAASNDLAHLLESLTRRRSTTVSFGTEAPHMRGLTSEAIVFGPGDMTTAHKTGESVPIKELSKCVACLKAVIGKLCGARV
jgi:acetylornithine deacetylase